MAIEVNGATYFHINSDANQSPHPLMRRGDTLEIGEETNPFFRFYESFSRTYPVRDPEGRITQIGAVAFLREVNDGHINPDNLAQTSLEVARHFMMLSRELVWENIRLNEFPEEPSRQRCIWLIETEDEARRWITTMRFPPMTYSIVKVRAMGNALRVDSNLLAADSEPLPVWYKKARRYWRGEMGDTPHPEVLFTGSLTVDEILPPPQTS